MRHAKATDGKYAQRLDFTNLLVPSARNVAVNK